MTQYRRRKTGTTGQRGKVFPVDRGGARTPGGRPKRSSFVPRKATSSGLPVMHPDEKPVPLKNPVHPPMRYFGGKYRQRRQIVSKMPPHKTYVEPFAGAANVLLAKPPSEKEVLSDKDPKVVKVHRAIKARSETWDEHPSRRRWDRIHDTAPSRRSGEDQAYLIDHAYGGFPEDRRQNYHDSGMKSTFDTSKVHARVRDALVLNRDFGAVMRMFDSPSTLHYLDPPYSKDVYKKYTEHEVRPADVAKVAGKMRGDVMVSYDDTAEVRRAFQGPRWRRTSYGVERSLEGHGARKQTREVLITNFDPTAERSGAPPFDETKARREVRRPGPRP